MEIKEEDYKRLMFNIYDLQDTDILTNKYPVLKLYPELSSLPIKYFKFVVLLYDINTPLIAIENYTKRIVEASILSGFTPISEVKFKKEDQNVIEFKTPSVINAIIKYCRIQREIDFSELKVYEIAFYNELQNLQTEEDALKRGYAIKNIDNLKEKIKELQVAFYNRNNNNILEINIMSIAEDETLGLRPEDIAIKQFNGEVALKYNYYE
jgi:hypothetical protein